MIDIRIMAHPSRRENVIKILKELDLSEDNVTWDDRPGKNDAMYTARKAWESPIPDNCTHRIVIQDDAELCNGFKDIAEEVAKKHPKEIVSFFHEGDIAGEGRYRAHVFTVGVALMVPIAMLDNFWWFVDNRLSVVAGPNYQEVIKHDTTCMRYWLQYQNIPCITTVPSIVQHIGDLSLVGDTRKRIAVDYMKNPPITGW